MPPLVILHYSDGETEELDWPTPEVDLSAPFSVDENGNHHEFTCMGYDFRGHLHYVEPT